MADFEADISDWVQRAKTQLVGFYMNVGNMAVARVKELTPVRTGNLRANWQLVVADSAVQVKGVETKTDVSPPPPLTFQLGQFLAVINPVEYARRVEYGFVGTDKSGHVYHQEGRHMLQQTFTELPQIAEKALVEAKK